MLATLLPGFAGTELPAWLRHRLRAGLGGVCLFAQNISSTEQLRALTDSITAENPYAIIAIDEEGGDVTRLFAATGAPFPGNAVLGRLDDLDNTRETAAAIGWSLRAGRLHGQLRSLRRRQLPPRQSGDRRTQLWWRRRNGGAARTRLGGWPAVDRRGRKRQAFPRAR